MGKIGPETMIFVLNYFYKLLTFVITANTARLVLDKVLIKCGCKI